MADKAHDLVDERLEAMEWRIRDIYEEAANGIEEKAADYLRRFEKLDEAKRKQMEAGKITEAEYREWRQNKMLYGKRYTDLKKQVAAELANVNKTAISYVNGQVPEIYALGYDAFSDVANGIPGYSFTAVNADTVRHLATTDNSLLPFKALDLSKDIPWNMKRVNAEMLQGILQGESIPKMAARMSRVTDSNRAAATRAARTLVTEAENKGRQDSYERAKKDGVMLKRKWIATYDMRTRHAHAMLDGKLSEVDEPFESELGPIMFPGDHTAHPSNVYNCRCTMGVKYMGFNGKKTKIKSGDDRETVAEWLEKEREKDPKGFDNKQKMVYNESADREQYQKYRKRIASELPKGGFKAFQEMKYNEPEKYAYLSGFYRYKLYNPESDKRFYDANLAIKKLMADGSIKAKGTLVAPSVKIKILNANDHAQKRFLERGLDEQWAQEVVNSSVFALKQRKGERYAYYSQNGMATVGVDGEIKTVGKLDDGGILLYKEVLKYVGK